MRALNNKLIGSLTKNQNYLWCAFSVSVWESLESFILGHSNEKSVELACTKGKKHFIVDVFKWKGGMSWVLKLNPPVSEQLYRLFRLNSEPSGTMNVKPL